MRILTTFLLAFLVAFTLGCDSGDDEPDHDYISRGDEACEVIAESPETAPEECLTWACATDEVLVCDTAIAYGETCDPWAESVGCAIEDVIRVHCEDCSNWE